MVPENTVLANYAEITVKMFREIPALYSENNRKDTSATCGQKRDLLILSRCA